MTQARSGGSNVDVILIGDAARRLGISTGRLIQAEKRGEIPRPAGKTSNGWRVYSEDDMRVLRQWRQKIADRNTARQAERTGKGAAQAAA
jgi:hypothetical protein